jgi:hypothetical protein
MVAVPAEIPVTMPVGLIVAVPELLHVPPVVASDNEVVRPVQTLIVPEMAVGNGLTVTIAVAVQPEASV